MTIAKRPVVAGLAIASVTLTGTTAMLVLPGGGSLGSRADAATTTAYAPDPESLLDGRSPGQRRYGWLLDNKPDRLAFSAGDPADERVLSSTRRRPGGDTVVPVVPGVPLTSFDAVPDTTGTATALGDPGIPGPVGGGIGGIGGAPITGGVTGPGGGGVTPSDPVTPTPEQPIAAVPEPASWAMLVLGFATLGIAMRRRRSVPIANTPH